MEQQARPRVFFLAEFFYLWVKRFDSAWLHPYKEDLHDRYHQKSAHRPLQGLSR